jgi:predicted lipoprotein with Yx(FWY)xxD motif
VKTASTPLGTILVDDSGRTLYLWEADRTARSTCDGACAQAWPPLTTSGAARAAGGAQATLLGTVRRSDGTMQVTYAQHPLYYYSGDTAAGQTSGQNSDGFGAEWYVVTPTGAADEHGSS